MKRAFIILSALFLSFVADAGTIKKVYEIDGFTGISVSDGFAITIEKASAFRVEIEVTEEFLPYVAVKNRSGVLELSFDKLPSRLKQKNRSKVAMAVIRMPELTMLTANGGSSVSSIGTFSDPMNSFSLELGGGSSVNGLDLKTPDIHIELAGASRAEINMVSGDVSAKLGGASKLNLSGDASSLTLSVSGASRVDADELKAEEIEVKAGGASSVSVRPADKLKVDLSGASRCVYYSDNEDLKLNLEKIAGASSIKRKK